MVVIGSNLGVDLETEKLMEEDNLALVESGKVVLDVEEGEISDSASLEEISAEDFKKQEGSESKPRVWTMKELYDYPGFRTDWYNLAWARGLQNQPLNGVVVVDVDQKLPSSAEPDRVVIDDSGDEAKEEGELEEGEIDLDSDPVSECDRDSVRRMLRSVDSVNAEQSFEEVCLRIHKTLEGLRVDKDDEIAHLLFSALQVVYSVFCTVKPIQKDDKKETLSRLLSSVMSCDPPILSTERLKEIELFIASLSSSDEEKESKSNEETSGMEIDSKISNANNSNGHGEEQEQEKMPVKWPSVTSLIHSKPVTTPQRASRVGVPSFKGRGLLVPLLDLHKDHDEDSLPSPTRDAPPNFPVADVTTKPGLPHYETDAFKAVSSYQQKFGRSSFLMSDMLPSPTPSDDESEEEDNDKEVSGLRTTGPTVSTPFLVASASVSQAPPVPAHVAAVPSTCTITPTTKPSAKSRDPRLRFANADSDLNQKPLITAQNTPATTGTSEHTNSRKQRAGVELNLEGLASKRQRQTFANGSSVSDIKSGSRSEDSNGGSRPPQLVNKTNSKLDPRRSHIALNSSPTVNVGKEQPVTTTTMTSTSNSLPGFLKDIAGNPEMLLNMITEQQQRLAQPMSDPSADLLTSTLLSGLTPLVSIPPLKASEILQPPLGSASATSQVGPVRTPDDGLKVRMKPRDPRRVLQGNVIQKTENPVNEQQLKTTAGPTITNKDSQNMQDGQVDKTKPIPDIARQFTKNLRNLADMISVSTPSPAVLQHNLSSQSAQVKPAVKALELNNENEEQSVSASTTEPSVSRGPNTWGDVEHLFKGYDDKQKMAIQRERERRLEEQNKMFEARKLCLVLDLDHTLLNSAKFVEVDLVHDEILRKKEEQDREKPQRHLYRLAHMGMWTKLRPGIWNFLDKASKLFEMHLYTMGNKLYATEMAKVLDPKGTLFSGRVISKGDDEEPADGDERVPKSKDLEGVMGMESSVLIIDDSVRVWPHNKLNLIVVERYTYFPCSRRQFGLPGPSLLEIDHDERPEEGTLASSLGVIERIHDKFFSSPSLDEADVRNILALEQQKILAGCRIVFSRVFPVSEVNPHLHPLWQSAQQFGAVCTTQIDDKVTHVVAHSPGTDKVNWAVANGRFVVHPGWVEASALLYRRANEQDFAIKPTQP